MVRGMIRRPIAIEAIGVGLGPPGRPDDEGGDDDRRGPEQVAHDLEVGAAHGQALALRAPEDPQTTRR